MKIGAVYPQTQLRGDPRAVRRFGQREGGPYNETHPFHDCFAMFSHLAVITRKLEFATGVFVLSQRQTALVARQAADVDLLSAGETRGILMHSTPHTAADTRRVARISRRQHVAR